MQSSILLRPETHCALCVTCPRHFSLAWRRRHRMHRLRPLYIVGQTRSYYEPGSLTSRKSSWVRSPEPFAEATIVALVIRIVIPLVIITIRCHQVCEFDLCQPLGCHVKASLPHAHQKHARIGALSKRIQQPNQWLRATIGVEHCCR
jgi:hypothetical protein